MINRIKDILFNLRLRRGYRLTCCLQTIVPLPQLPHNGSYWHDLSMLYYPEYRKLSEEVMDFLDDAVPYRWVDYQDIVFSRKEHATLFVMMFNAKVVE